MVFRRVNSNTLYSLSWLWRVFFIRKKGQKRGKK
nr:MAG TPA: hypothetical protein [Caudoviricetes sp.]